MDVFKRAKIARWRHCNADSLKTLKSNYMSIRLLCVYRMTTYVRQNFAFKFQAIAEKTAKNLRGYFFCRILYIEQGFCLFGQWNPTPYVNKIIADIYGHNVLSFERSIQIFEFITLHINLLICWSCWDLWQWIVFCRFSRNMVKFWGLWHIQRTVSNGTSNTSDYRVLDTITVNGDRGFD